MKTVKTSELIGPELDWAVAKCEGTPVEIHSAAMITARRLRHMTDEEAATLSPPKPYLVMPGIGVVAYSTSWAQGGPIIEREKIEVLPMLNPEYWSCRVAKKSRWHEGPTPLVAAMRVFVAIKLGDTVEIPEGL